jgi:guanylate kinase
MKIYSDKKIVCITGSVWTGSRSAPWRLLKKNGFLHTRWFATYRPITGDKYKLISSEKFHITLANDEVLAYTKYGGGFIGINIDDFENALETSSAGVLVVGFGFQEIIAQVSESIPQVIIFTLKNISMDISPHLFAADNRGQSHRIDENVLESGTWRKTYNEMLKTLNLPSIVTGK